jgi:hypothetical protein
VEGAGGVACAEELGVTIRGAKTGSADLTMVGGADIVGRDFVGVVVVGVVGAGGCEESAEDVYSVGVGEGIGVVGAEDEEGV